MRKNFELIEMVVVSRREKRGLKIRFNRAATVIKGANDTGKSSLIKTIFLSFGATPQKVHPRWKEADPASLIRFAVGGIKYAIYRHGNSYSLFDQADELLGTYRSVTNELALAASELFDFGLVLSNRQRESKTPPPAYYFLPFYIDQDGGWSANWNSFEGLGQYPNSKQSLVFYHTGLRPNDWYRIKGQERDLKAQREEPLREEAMLSNLLTDLERRLNEVRFDVDIDAYKTRIDDLLRVCQHLKQRENEYRATLVDLETEHIRLEAQHEIVDRARQEIGADFQYASDKLGDQVECPTCRTPHANSFAERFSLARDEDRCVSLLHELQQGLAANADAISSHRESLQSTQREAEDVRRQLDTEQGEVTLRDLLELEGKREFATELHSRLADTRGRLALLDASMRELAQTLKNIEDPKRSKAIKTSYLTRMKRYLRVLAVDSLDESSYKRIDSNIKESGSDLPRAILAYAFSILHLIADNGSAALAPIVVDSPMQQEQDPENHRRMLEFIRDERPTGTQLVLGLVDDLDIDFGGSIVTLDNKNYCLLEEEFKACIAEVKQYEDKSLGLTR